MISTNFLKFIISFLVALLFIPLSCKKNESAEESLKTVQKAVVTFIAGNVKSISADGMSGPLKVKDVVKPGSTIETGNKSYATFQIKRIGVLHLTENSRLEMKEIFGGDESTVVNLKSGSVFSKIEKRTGIHYRVQTKTLVASVRGTQFLVQANPGFQKVLVREGSVAVAGKTTGKEKIVTKKMSALVDQNERISLSSQKRAEELVLEQYALHPFVKNVESKTTEEIEKEFEKVNSEKEKINEERLGLQETLLDKLRKQGKPLVKLYLKDGSQLIGAVENTTADKVNLNTGENIISIPKSEIRRRIPAK